MSEFEIDFGAAAKWADQIEGYSELLKQKKEQAEGAARQLKSIGGYRGMESALSKITNNLHTQQKQMKQYGGMLRNIAKVYKDTETSIVDSVSTIAKVEKAADVAMDLEESILSKFGVAGSMAVSVEKLINALASGDVDEKDAIKFIKGLVSNGGKITGTLGKKESERDWSKTLLGISSDTMADKLKIKPDASIGVQWDAYVKDQMSGYSFSNAKTLGAKVQVGAKYAASALAFAVTALSNKEEQGDVMNARAWEETIVETAVGAAEGFAIGAAVTLALGPGAPAVAATLAAVGVTWAIDTIVEAVTGESFVETVSDFVCDTAEKVTNTVVDWGRSTWDTMKNFFSGGNKKAVPAGSGGW